MVNPRIYRSGLALVAVAVIVFGFSLGSQPTAPPTNLAPAAVGGKIPYKTMLTMARRFPDRLPGSAGDLRLANYVAAQLQGTGGFDITSSTVQARTAQGERPIATVTATRTGLTGGAIVVVSHRDSASSPGLADLSGTAVLLDLAHVLSGETERHTLILISTSGSVGSAGAAQVAHTLSGQPVDAVITLGDMAAARPTQPVVIPWSDASVAAPPLLRRTLDRYVQINTGLQVGAGNLGAQFAHLAFPLTLSDQGPFGHYGIPAIALSMSGYRPPAPNEQLSPLRIQQSENTVLQSLNALDNGPSVPPPRAYLLLSGKVVPGWAIRLLVLALILPVAMATVDAVARVRRRGHSLRRWLVWVLGSALPFLLAVLVVLFVKVTGLLAATPPGPVAGGVPIGAGGFVLMAVLALVITLSFVFLRPRLIGLAAGSGAGRRLPSSPAADAAAVAMMLVLTATTLVVWVTNPFAAALLLPALHLWLWFGLPSVRSRRALMLVLGPLGLVPGLLVITYYAHAYGLTPLGFVWSGVLLVAGGQISPEAALALSLLLGCAVSALVIALRAAPAPSEPTPVTVRGPVTYAGPGSLGGTKSALGSRR